MANYRKSFNFRNGVQVDNDNFIVNPNGLVGIGTSVPTELLDVRGTTKVTGIVTTTNLWVNENLYVGGISTVGFITASDISVSGVVTATKFKGDGSELSGLAQAAWNITSAGLSTLTDVGIGTTNPEYKLQIGFNPSTGSGTGIDSTGNGFFSGIVTTGGLETTGFVTTGNLYVSGVTSHFDDLTLFGAGGNASWDRDGGSGQGQLGFSDNVRAVFGTGNDLKIFHGNSPYDSESADQHSYIQDSGTGDLVLLSNQVAIRNAAETEDMARFYSDGSVELRYNGSKKFETSGLGVTVTGVTSTTDLWVDEDVYITGVATATTFFGALTGTASTATASATAFGLSGTPHVTVGNLIGAAATFTNLEVDNYAFSVLSTGKVGIGTSISTADLQINKSTNTLLEVITSSNTSSVSVGQSVGLGNSSGALQFNSGTLKLKNYDLGGVEVELHAGTGSGTTESFKVVHDDNTQFEATYDGKVGVNRPGVNLSRNLEVGGNAYITRDLEVVGVITAGVGANQITFGDGSSIPFPESQQFNIISGISTFNNLNVGRDQRVGGSSTISGNLFAAGSVGFGTTGSAGFLGGGNFSVEVFGDLLSHEGIIAQSKGGLSTATDGSLLGDPRSVAISLLPDENVVSPLSYGTFQVDTADQGFSVIGKQSLFVPTVGVPVAGFGATNLGILPKDFAKQKSLSTVGINTYFARSVLDVGAATTTNNSYFIPPSVTSGELEIIANLWTGKIVGYGTVRAKQVTPDGVPGGALVYNRTNTRLEVGIGTTTFCGIATLTNNHTGYSAYVPPYVNTEQRLALTNAGIASGAIIFNPLNKRLEMYKDAVTGWVGIATGSTTGAVSLDDLIDVEVPYPNDKDSLVWNAGASKWVPFNVGTGRFISNDTGISTNTNLGIGTTTASSALTVSGDGIFTGVVTATSFIGSGVNLTGVGTQGLNVQAQSLTVAGISTFHNDIKIGTGVTIESNGDATYTGIVTAGSFVGDGSGLTGVGTQGINGQFRGLVVAGVSTLGVTSVSNLGVEELNVTGISTFTTVSLLKGLSVVDITGSGLVASGVVTATTVDAGIVTSTNLYVTGVSTVGVITGGTSVGASNFYGNLVGDVTGDVTGNTTGNLTGNVYSASGISTFMGSVGIGTTDIVGAAKTLNTSVLNAGIVTAAYFYGDGSGLTNSSATLAAASGTQRVVLTSLTSGDMVNAATDGDLSFTVATNTLNTINISATAANYTGIVTASSFVGDITGDVTGASSKITLGNESTDTTCFPIFVTAATGDLAPKTNTNLSFDSSNGTLSAAKFSGPASALTNDASVNTSGVITASSFVGDGSGLTSVIGSGSGVVIKHDDATVGTAGTINFSSNLDVSDISAGVVTVTASGGGGGASGVWATTDAGINTTSSVGVGTTNPQSTFQVERYGIQTGLGTFDAIAGVAQTVDTFAISSTDYRTAEYTLHFERGIDIQAQKLLVMQNGTTAYSQEYATMAESNTIVSVAATITGGTTCEILITPEIGISGLTTYRFVRGALL
tara:strand:+ start:20429 stop:24982 length:4554 start_codon:yes stop_codon:yes gene_type:complete